MGLFDKKFGEDEINNKPVEIELFNNNNKKYDMELFDRRFVHCMWTDELINKKGFFANSIKDLHSLVNKLPELTRTCHDNDSEDYPFYYDEDNKDVSYNVWKFFYYDPNYEVKKAYLEGKKIQHNFRLSRNWIKDNWLDVGDLGAKGLSWFDSDINGEYRIKPEPEAEEPKYRPFKSVDELVQYWDNNYDSNRPKHTMPLIWVEAKDVCVKDFITSFDANEVRVQDNWITLDSLFKTHLFLDGKPCGVLEG